MDDTEFFKKLLSTFKAEAVERLQKISLSLLELEKAQNTDQAIALVEGIYREFHSLKSASRAVNMDKVEKVCQKLESAFSDWKKNKQKPSEQQFDALHKLNIRLEQFINGPSIRQVHFQQDCEALLEKLHLGIEKNNVNKLKSNSKTAEKITGEQSKAKANKTKANEAVPFMNPFYSDAEGMEKEPSLEKNRPETKVTSFVERRGNLEEKTIRIPAAKLDSLLVQSEEMLAAKLNFARRGEELNTIKNDIVVFRKNFSKILEEKSYFEHSEADLKNILSNLDSLTNSFEQNMRGFSLGIDNLLEDSKKMMLLPFSTILNILPVTVRDLSHSLDKKVNLQLRGAELEIDKRILEEMKDVMIHLLRNAIDHGIETPEERKALKKPEVATLSIDIQHMTGNEIQLEIVDDGRGINIENVKKSAVKQGVISSEEASTLPEHDALMLIFQSGVSTQNKVTELSGRGLGMSIIREKIEKVGGKITVHTESNVGTTIKISLPLSLATFKGLLVQIAKQDFVVPTSNLDSIISVKVKDIKKVENKETIVHDNRVVSLVWLADILGLNRKATEGEILLALILSSVDHAMAFVVDEILNESEILVKQFTYPIIKIKNIAAAAILGSGIPIPILNTLDLLEHHQFLSPGLKEEALEEEPFKNNKRVLLAEDSITTRMLIKNILELDGFQVTTAVDGLEAWEKLRENDFALIVSDIEMPRMTGFELTKKVRKDKKFSSLPIILITSLESKQDREKGIDLGANAYIVKSNFDSNHLLDIINKLSL